MKKQLIQWEKETEKLKDIFVKKYFGDMASDVYWVANEIGGVLVVNDYFFNLERIIETIKYSASNKKLFEYQEEELKFATLNKPMKINFRNYIKYKIKI